jgi:hypothetical protein
VEDREAQEVEALVTCRSAIITAFITLLPPFLGYLDYPSGGRQVLISRVVSFAWALAWLGMLTGQRKRPNLWFSRIAVGAIPLPLLDMFWLIAHERAARGLPVELFIRENTGSIVFAAVTPPSATMTLMLIAAFTTQNLLAYWKGGAALVPATTHMQPLTSLLLGACAVGIALYRSARLRREVSLVLMQQRAIALERFTRSLLALRDLVNTPLQTLEVSLSLLGDRCPNAQDLAATMQRSVARLREMNEILSVKAAEIKWRVGDESFDPTEVLRTHIMRSRNPSDKPFHPPSR